MGDYRTRGNYTFDRRKNLDSIRRNLGGNFEVITAFEFGRCLEENLDATGKLTWKLRDESKQYIMADSQYGILLFVKTDKPGDQSLAEYGICGTRIPQNWIHAMCLANSGEIICGRDYSITIGNKSIKMNLK